MAGVCGVSVLRRAVAGLGADPGRRQEEEEEDHAPAQERTATHRTAASPPPHTTQGASSAPVHTGSLENSPNRESVQHSQVMLNLLGPLLVMLLLLYGNEGIALKNSFFH